MNFSTILSICGGGRMNVSGWKDDQEVADEQKIIPSCHNEFNFNFDIWRHVRKIIRIIWIMYAISDKIKI